MRISDWSSDVCSSDLCWRLTAKTLPCPIPITIKTEVIAVTTDIQDSRSARFALRCSSFAERWFPDSWVFAARSEEHTSELQSLMRNSYAVFCMKKTNKHTPVTARQLHRRMPCLN